MAQVEYIRYLRNKEGLSIAEIARRVQVSWPTAKKYADADCIEYQKGPKKKRVAPVMGPYMEVVDAWLQEDERVNKKQRRTAKMIYEQLCKETGFSGSERTVRDYVRSRKLEMVTLAQEQYVRLEHLAGETQVDFGNFQAIDTHTLELVMYKFLVMSFPYSNAELKRVVPAENTECFLWALRDMFEELNGVPIRIVFDNLSAAVNKVLRGSERNLTRMFAEFQDFYGFKAVFCNPGRGNEKGHCEGKVGYVRRNQLTPMPFTGDLLEYNNELKRKGTKDRQRMHYRKNRLIEELWQEDLAALRPLPDEQFEVVRLATAKANKYSEISVGKHEYHVPMLKSGQNVFVKVHWDNIEIYDEYGEEFVLRCPRKYALKTELIDWAAELTIYANKPRAIEYATHLKALPKPIMDYLLAPQLNDRRVRVRNIITLLADYSVLEIAAVLEPYQSFEDVDLNSLKMLLSLRTAQEPAQPLSETWTPQSLSNWQPALSQYDLLSPVGGDNNG